MNVYVVTAIVVSERAPNPESLTWDAPEGAEVIHSTTEELTERYHGGTTMSYAQERLMEVFGNEDS